MYHLYAHWLCKSGILARKVFKMYAFIYTSFFYSEKRNYNENLYQ
nr:MAG TPA: hypothetical protein [Caudoviricetes sp.]